MAIQPKVQEIAKDLKLTSKEIIEKLSKMGHILRGPSSQLNDEQLGIIFDIFTNMYDMGDEPIVKPPREPKPEKKSEPAKKSAPSKKAERAPAAEEKPAAAPKPEKKSEEKPAAKKSAAKNTEEKKPAEEKPSAEKKQEKKAQPVKEEKKPAAAKKTPPAPPAPRKKKKEEPVVAVVEELSDEDLVIKTEQTSRYVDTRTSTVELETIETRERLEDMVSDNMQNVGGRSKKKKKANRDRAARGEQQAKHEEAKTESRKSETPQLIEIPETITVGEFAQKIGKGAAEVIKKLMMLGVMATVNQPIDFETAQLIASDFGIEVKQEVILTKEDILFREEEDSPEDLVPRPPVVVVMGHVDHGKTSLLDAIRDTSVASGEAGGITQHIGAYGVRLNDRDITFLDTPGHEAFTTMRARGAQVTDVAILVVAADDGIMPQTIEAINHAKAANVTIVVAINKIDKENANVERVKQMLVEHELVPEEWGGDTVCVEVSAKQRINIDGLLEMVLLVADMKELKANPNKAARGTVIEAQVDKGRGPVATVLVQEGTLKVGDIVIAGTAVGHVRAMVNDKGRRVKTAGPSTPVEILGLSEVPSGGDHFSVVSDEKLARDVAEARRREQKETQFNQTVKVSLDNLFSQIDEGNMKELNVIIKADVQGSVEAVKQSLEKLSNDEVRVRAIHGGVGAVNESDVMLANASNAIIVGFNVRPDAGASALSLIHI